MSNLKNTPKPVFDVLNDKLLFHQHEIPITAAEKLSWDNAESTLRSASGEWESVYSTVESNSGVWDDASTNYMSSSGNFITLDGDQTITGVKIFDADVHVNGALYATSSVIITTENIAVSSNFITLNHNVTGALSGEDAGIRVWRGAATPSDLRWNGTTSKWMGGLTGDLKDIAYYEDISGGFVTLGTDQTISGQKTFIGGISSQRGGVVGGNEFFGLGSGKNTVYVAATAGYDNTCLGVDALGSNVSGSVNIAIGSETLFSLTSGDGNTAVGSYAMNASVTANNNTAIGFDALYNIAGNGNVALGYYAGFNQMAASNQLIIDNQDRGSSDNEYANSLIVGAFDAVAANQTIGLNAFTTSRYGVSSPMGAVNLYNEVFGAEAGTSLLNNGVVINATAIVPESDYIIIATGDTDFTVIGAANSNPGTIFNAMDVGTGTGTVALHVTNCLLVGRQAGVHTKTSRRLVIDAFDRGNTDTEDTDSLIVGIFSDVAANQSLAINAYTTVRYGLSSPGAISLLQNEAFGSSALYTVTTGSYNTAVGNSAMASNTTGSNNVAVGGSSLCANTEGYNNCAMGSQALCTNTLGYNNVAIGRAAMFDNTEGTENTAVGSNSLYSNTVGVDNVAIGYQALKLNTEGYDNTATGRRSLYSNTTGYGNTASGSGALFFNTTGTANTTTGYAAMTANTEGSNNTAIGSYSLYSNVTGGGNVAIGYCAGKYELGSSAFYVDNQDRTNTAGDKSKALMYGVFNATASSQTLTVNAALTATYGVNIPSGQTYKINNAALAYGDVGAASAAQGSAADSAYAAAVTNATSSNTASTLVKRDGTGNFSAGTITAALTGTASKATNLVGDGSVTHVGAMFYQTGVDTTSLLEPNKTTTRKFLRETGDGANGAAPAWDTIAAEDVPALNQDTTGSAKYLKDVATTGRISITGITAGATRAKTLRDADDTILELGGTYSPSGVWSYANKVGVSSTYAVTSPATDLHAATSATTSPRGIMSSQHNDGTEPARFHGRKSRGTLAIPAAVLTGDNLARWVASGHDGTNYLEMASIEMSATGTVGSTRVPTNITFRTATDAAPSVLTEHMKLDSSGTLTLTGSTLTDYPTLSAELLSSSGWTSTDWTGDWATGWIHTIGNTTPLSNSAAAIIGYYYSIQYTITGNVTASYNLSFGGVTRTYVTGNVTWSCLAVTTDGLVITPTGAGADGTITNISIKRVLASSTPSVVIADSAGVTRVQMRVTNSTSNTYLGLDGGRQNTTGTYNTAVGNGALQYNVSGGENSALGIGALSGNVSGTGNSAVGAYAAYHMLKGNYNTAMGWFALSSAVGGAGDINSAFGYSSLSYVTSGGYNTAVGGAACNHVTTGAYNASLGVSSLFTCSTGNYNTAVGVGSLYSAAGSSNVALGYDAGRYETGSNAFYIDNQDRTDTAGDKSKALVYGVFAATPASQTWTHNSKVGISTTYSVQAPATDLHVASSDTASPRGIMSSQHSTGVDGARLHTRKSRGTLTVPVAVESGDMVGRWVGSAYDGANYLEMASVDFVANRVGGFTATRIPMDIVFNAGSNTVPSVLTERLRISGQYGRVTATLTKSTTYNEMAVNINTDGGTAADSIFMGFGAARGFIGYDGANISGIGSYPFIVAAAVGKPLGLISNGATAAKYDESSCYVFNPLAASARNFTINKVTTGTALVYNGTADTLTIGSELTMSAGITSPLVAASLFNEIYGSGAGKAGMTGTYNTAVGYRALHSITSGNYNVAIGGQALNSVSTTDGSIAIGMNTLYSATGSGNIGIGTNAGTNISTGGNNLALGINTLATNTTGSGNVAVGHVALNLNTGSNNVALGFGAGRNQTVVSNTFFLDCGFNRGSAAAELTGSMLYGVGDPTVANQFLTANGKFGINTSTFGTVSKFMVNAGTTVDNAACAQFTSTADANKCLVLQRFSATQSANIFEIQQSTGAAIFSVGNNGALTVTPVATTGTPPIGISFTAAAHTALTASTEFNALHFNGGVTQQFATGALTTERFFRITAPTYSAVAASVITNAATVAISGAPTAGAFCTITNPYALWVQAGTARFEGTVSLGGTLSMTSLTTSSFRVAGVNSVATTGGTTAGAATDHVVVFTGSLTHTYTLPACSTGRVLTIKNRSAGDVTVQRAGSDTIDGSATPSDLAANDSVTLVGNGADWTIV